MTGLCLCIVVILLSLSLRNLDQFPLACRAFLADVAAVCTRLGCRRYLFTAHNGPLPVNVQISLNGSRLPSSYMLFASLSWSVQRMKLAGSSALSFSIMSQLAESWVQIIERH